MDRNGADDALANFMEVVSGLIDLVEQAARRGGTDLGSLKAQCFDLTLEAIAANATRLADDASVPTALRERSRALADRLQAHQRSFADVRLHLIDLAEDWQCPACGRDVAAGAAIMSTSPLIAALVCKACRARGLLTARGAQRLQELFGTIATPAWNPALNGFVV